ncbi:MAG: hypothetical protein L0332_02235 [Chloroflexi bacterium]|nr:hypothetical protein [Chloroflexota bacterium]MCI0577540.1 hypothetical protein [Chloroflexota bacterium]MCI0645621.1 hypothetical protein [Chloroflexota bacterium]MCI0725533.1 hypothetical protein [Chloroflexota bacterium]
MELYSTTVTNIKPLTKIRRERVLPEQGEVVVRVGQDVSPVQVVARVTQNTGFHILRASEVLGVRPDQLEKYLLVEEGAAVQRGMPLMRKPRRFGRGKRYACPVDGVLYQIRNGFLILQQTPELFELRAMMHGRVAALIPNRGVALEANGTLIQALWDSGKEGVGKVKVAVETSADALDDAQLGADVRGLVVVAGRVKNVEVLHKLEEGGVRGVVVGSISADLCQATGRFSFPVIVTDAIGTQPMAEPVFQLLLQSEGREASLFATRTDQRRGRPEIIIPLPTAHSQDQPTSGGEPLAVGKKVRVLRAGSGPHIGKVVAVHTQPRHTPLGALLMGADVELANGEVVFVPYTNLDLLV